jgi:hypothetical protein
VKTLRDGVVGRRGNLELAAAADDAAKTAAGHWSPELKKLESAVQSNTLGFKKCEQSQGRAEGMIREAIVEMVCRAGAQREHGGSG